MWFRNDDRFARLSRALPALVLACALGVGSTARAADVRVGGAGATVDAAKLDDAWPDMKEWAAAGVRGGIPPRADGRVVRTVKPGDDVQAAVDAAAKDGGGGIVVLAVGVHPLARRLDLRSNVVLRGEERDGSILECTIRAKKPSDAAVAVRFDGTTRAGLEDLTVRHAEVAKLGFAAYAEQAGGPKNEPTGVADLYVAGVQLERAEDCWIDNCAIVHSGTHPLDAQGKSITVRDSLIDGAYNAGDEGGPAGSGNVYFAVDHGLMYDVTVRHTRHALVVRDTLAGAKCKFNAFVDCTFVGDVNFHGNRKDDGHNLFEGTLVHAPPTHGWPAWSYWKRTDIGPENLAYQSIGWGGPGKDAFASTKPDAVYTFTGMHDPNVLGIVADRKPPKTGTLYATTADRPTRIDAGGGAAWPATAGEAGKAMQQRLEVAK